MNLQQLSDNWYHLTGGELTVTSPAPDYNEGKWQLDMTCVWLNLSTTLEADTLDAVLQLGRHALSKAESALGIHTLGGN